MPLHPVPKPEPIKKRKPNPGHPYLAWCKTQPCALTGETGRSEAAHVQGPISLKTGLILPRRKHEAYVSAIPLTPEKHRTDPDSLENLGERKWSLYHYGREDALARIAMWHLCRWALTRASV